MLCADKFSGVNDIVNRFLKYRKEKSSYPFSFLLNYENG